MSKRVYSVVAVAVLVCVAGLVAAQVAGSKPAESAAVAAKEKPKPLTVEQRIVNLEKNQEKILGELKEIKQNQEEILELSKKIFTGMKRK
jgi:hypothetical protein